MSLPEISFKLNRVLRIILMAFLIIVLRIWHLGVIQRDEKLAQAQKPQQRSILLHADRGTICDRFHIPLALNRICYNAAIYYGQIAQIPMVAWKCDPSGKQVKTYARKEYIRSLAAAIGEVLHLDPARIEDLVHSKASLFPQAPFILKADISEEEHYRFRSLEKEWLGVHAEISSTRYYPLGKVGCNLVGTMGAINRKEYLTIAQEINELQAAALLYEQGLESSLPQGFDSFEEVYRRLGELKEKAYTFNDLIGKTGIEAQFEEELRGFYGKKTFEVDQKGRFLRELPGGKEAVPGRQVILSISSELQQFAETLLAEDEKNREGRSLGFDPADKVRKVQKQPWIKGGAIVALDPKTGEVLALASHPRFDPNDFIPTANDLYKSGKLQQVNRWLENERFVASLWDGQASLSRERDKEEFQPLTWELTLDFILPQDGPLRAFFHRMDDLKSAIQIQEDFETLRYFSRLSPPDLIQALFSPGKLPLLEEAAAMRRLESFLGPIPSHEDKLFAIDLCRLAVYSPAFTDSLISEVGGMKIGRYRELTQAFFRLEQEVKREALKKFHEEEFLKWREENQKEFLAEKRRLEREAKSYAKPYVDYLDEKEKELFAAFWEEKKIPLLIEKISDELLLKNGCQFLSSELKEEFFRTFRSFSQLNRPLLTRYKTLRNRQREQTEKDLAAAFYPIGGFGFNRSYAFQVGVPQGSIFKLVTAFEGLRQGHSLTLVDESNRDAVAFTLNRTPYPRFYKGGRLPRSAATRIGKIDLPGALEQTSNPYFSILAGDYFENPEDLAKAASLFGFGERSGIELPGENRGNVPNDLKTNRTGLYSTAIGQHTLLTSPLQTANMLAALVNGGKLIKPKIAKCAIGFAPDREPLGIFSASSYFAKEELDLLGIRFPLFTAVQAPPPLPERTEPSTEIRRVIPIPAPIRSQLLEGMSRVVTGEKGSARAAIIKGLRRNPKWMKDYLSLSQEMVGKTGTAEILFKPSINPSALPQMYKYVWFGGVSFQDKSRDDPELVVVVFLRYADAGKEAAPLASQMILKWREIKNRHL